MNVSPCNPQTLYVKALSRWRPEDETVDTSEMVQVERQCSIATPGSHDSRVNGGEPADADSDKAARNKMVLVVLVRDFRVTP